MTDTFLQVGSEFEYSNSSGAAISAGDVIVSGDMCLIAKTDIANGASGAVYAFGTVHELTSEGDTAWVQGDQLYWDPYLLECTKTASSYNKIGCAAAAKAAAGKTGQVLLNVNCV